MQASLFPTLPWKFRLSLVLGASFCRAKRRSCTRTFAASMANDQSHGPSRVLLESFFSLPKIDPNKESYDLSMAEC